MWAALKSLNMHFFRFPSLHEHLAQVGDLEKQKQFRWNLLVGQQQVFLRCAAHSRQDLADEVLYIDSALVDGWVLPVPPVEKSRRYHVQKLRSQATLCCNERSVLSRVLRQLFPDRTIYPCHAASFPTNRPKERVSGKKMPGWPQAGAQHQKFCRWCPDDEIAPTTSLPLVHGVTIRLCHSAVPIDIRYCFSVTCRASSSSLPSPSSSPSSSSPLQPPCWRRRTGQSTSAAAADDLDAGTKGRALDTTRHEEGQIAVVRDIVDGEQHADLVANEVAPVHRRRGNTHGCLDASNC